MITWITHTLRPVSSLTKKYQSSLNRKTHLKACFSLSLSRPRSQHWHGDMRSHVGQSQVPAREAAALSFEIRSIWHR